MPNWCANSVIIKADPKNLTQRLLIKSIEKRIDESENWFEVIIPIPPEQEDNWYSFCVENWGTKWGDRESNYYLDDENTIVINFDTAWSPPIGIYAKLHEMGLEVKASYVEHGCDYIGYFVDGIDFTDVLSEIMDKSHDDYDEEEDDTGYYEDLEEAMMNYFDERDLPSPGWLGG